MLKKKSSPLDCEAQAEGLRMGWGGGGVGERGTEPQSPLELVNSKRYFDLLLVSRTTTVYSHHLGIWLKMQILSPDGLGWGSRGDSAFLVKTSQGMLVLQP